MRLFHFAVWGLLGGLAGSVSTHALLVTDFEPASGFVAGSSIGGVGHWQVLAGNASTTPGGIYGTVLEGTQSAALYGSTVWSTRNFTDVPVMTDGTTVSWHMSVRGNQGSADTYLSHNLGGLSTPVGILAPIGGNFALSGGSVPVPGSTVPVVTNREYLLEMTLDFFAGNAQCYVTDLDTPSARDFLGLVTFATPFSATQVQNNGGLFLISSVRDNDEDIGAAASFYDNFVVLPPGTEPQWGAGGSGDWNNPGNWIGGVVPNAVDASAKFLGSINAPQTVYSNSVVTVGSLVFNNANSYILAGAGILMIDVSTGSGSIDVVAGNHKINLPLSIADSTVINVSAASTLAISDPTIMAGITLTKNGTGTLVFQSTLNATSAATIKINGGVVNLDAANNDSDISIHVDPATLNLGANQSIGALTLSLGGNLVRVGRDSAGATVDARLTATGLAVTGGGSNTLDQPLAGNAVKINGVLQIDSNSKLVKTGAGVLSAASVNLAATAQLDLTNGKMMVDYVGSSPLSTVLGLLNSGRAGGAWNGNGINSSTAASTANRALGYVDTSVTGPQAFGSETADGSAILIAYTAMGDANLDGTVNSLDFSAFTSGYGTTVDGRWFKGDFDYDGKVSTLDFNYLAGNFGTVLPAPSLGSVVPEPASAGLALIAASVGTRRRRR